METTRATLREPNSTAGQVPEDLYFRSRSDLEAQLEEFGDSAFSGVKEADFYNCDTFRSVADISRLRLMSLGSNLETLGIEGAVTTPFTMASFLMTLTHLRRFQVQNLRIEDDISPVEMINRIPFFSGANEMRIYSTDFLPGKLDWIPPSARFSDLQVGASCFYQNPEVVQKWITSSNRTLKNLSIVMEGPDVPIPAPLELDLSGCTSLETLQLPILLDFPEQPARVVLPPSSVTLCILGEGDVEPQERKGQEENLSKLAEKFEVPPGEREINVYLTWGLTASKVVASWRL